MAKVNKNDRQCNAGEHYSTVEFIGNIFAPSSSLGTLTVSVKI